MQVIPKKNKGAKTDEQPDCTQPPTKRSLETSKICSAKDGRRFLAGVPPTSHIRPSEK